MMPGGQHQHEGAVEVPDQGQDEPGQEQEHVGVEMLEVLRIRSDVIFDTNPT